jgi:hypothetical protein
MQFTRSHSYLLSTELRIRLFTYYLHISYFSVLYFPRGFYLKAFWYCFCSSWYNVPLYLTTLLYHTLSILSDWWLFTIWTKKKMQKSSRKNARLSACKHTNNQFHWYVTSILYINPHRCGFESWQEHWILLCEEAIQLAYGTSVILLRSPFAPEIMHGMVQEVFLQQ